MTRTNGRALAIPLAVALLSALSVGRVAAYDEFISPIAEIPLTSPLVSGARSLGMGGVGLAVVDDSWAVSSNPAGLARMRRIELACGLTKSSDDLEGSAFGGDFDTSLSRTNLSSIRFAYPFPTFRGSLVFGLGGARVHSFDDDFLAAFEDTISWEENEGDFLTGPWSQIEDHIAQGGIYAWTLAAAMDASPGVSLGASVSLWTGSFSRDFIWTADDSHELSDNYDRYRLTVSSDADVSGFRARLGGLFYLAEGLSAALVVDSPIALTFDGTEVVRQEFDGVAEEPQITYFSDELTLPFTLGAGVAYSPTDLFVVAGDVWYTDWSEMTYEGFLYLDDPAERRAAYEATTDYRIGAELTVPAWPVRLRAGYMSRPLPYRGLDVTSDRAYVSLGVGVLIDTVLAVDVAWLHGSYERTGPDYDYVERTSGSALVVEAAYRF
jgi:uncharacterized protein YneR